MNSTRRTRIQLCGRLVVELEGRRVEESLPSRQGRLLFAYLVLHRERACRRDELIDCVWPERPPADPASALNTLISRLRRAIGAGAIEGRAELSFVLPEGGEIDVELAFGALARAQAAAADRDWQATWGPGHAALAIAQRGLLPGLDAPWIESWRRDLDELELKALELVAETGLGLGGAELAAAERGARTLVERAPFRESGYALRMRVLAARGNVAEALQVYDNVRVLLRDELGTAPSQELVALHRSLLEGAVPELGRQPQPRRPPAAGSAFVGRSRELEVLEGALAAAANGRRGLVLIGGEAGIGKTRIAEELAHRSDADWDVAWSRCYDGQGAPAFWPWLELVRGLAATQTPQRLLRALGPGAADLAQIAPELRELFADLEPPQLADPETARFRLFDAVERFLVRLAQVRPLVLVLDDLQWADAPSLELLRYVATRPDDAPILIVGTYRKPDVAGADPLAELLAALASKTDVRRIELAGLGEEAVQELLASSAGGELSAGVVAAVHHRTDGNPFFVSQLVGELDAHGDLSADEAEAILRRDVPGGVRDVIRQRLARLPPGAEELLAVAAVAGEEFELEQLARVLELDPDRSLELVEATLRHGIASEASSLPGRYRFSHALFRETIYGQQSAMRRARLHRRVAEDLEALDGDAGDRLPELAYHFYEAVPAGTADRAYEYAVAAADQATARLGYEEAEQYLRRALELFDQAVSGADRAQRELDLQARVGTLLMMTKGYAAPEVGAACARALELCREGEVGDEQQLLASLWRLGVFYEVRGDFRTSSAIGEQLLELRERSRRAQAFELAGRQLMGVAAVQDGDPGTARRHLTEVRALAESLGDPLADVFGMNFRVTSRAFLGWASTLLGDADDELAGESLELARLHSGPPDQAFALYLGALCAVLQRRVELAHGRAEEAVALCDEHGFRLFGAMAAVLRGWATAADGDADTGAADCEAAIGAVEATGALMMLHCFRGLLAESLGRAGQPASGLRVVEQGLSEVATTGRFYEAELHRLRAELLLALGPERRDEALTALRTAQAVARSQQATLLELRARASLHELEV